MSNEKAKKSNFTAPIGRRRMGPPGTIQVEKANDRKGTVKRLFKYFTSELATIIFLLIIVTLMVFCLIYAPKLQSDAIDLIKDKKFDMVGKVCITMLIVLILTSLCMLGQGILSAKLSQKVTKKLRNDLFDKVVNLPIKYIDSHPHGDIMSRMTNDVENISNTISQSLGSLVSGVLTIIGTVIMMMLQCPQLALLSCLTVLLTLGVTKFLSKNMKKFFFKRQKLLGDLNSITEENITGYKTVMAYNKQEDIINDFNKTSDRLTKVGIKAEIIGGSMGPVMNCVNNIGFVIITGFGGYFALKGIISIGMISAFIIYAKQFGRPINEIAQLYGQIQSAIAGAERVFEILDEENENKDGTLPMPDKEGIISFKHVDFSYVPEKQILYDFDLEVRAGHKVALVGATGSGKTTVVNLLMRFYDIDKGAIEIDGVNIKDMDIEELRKNIAIVLQDTVLFSDTIENNLKYSNLNASDEEIKNACEIGNSKKMIKHMKDGFKTVLQESGKNLSQGQRQLLSISRAILANPKILILDEATSSVDTRTEKNIQNAMVNLMKNRTSLIIAHRLSTIHDADHIVVLDNGHIVEAGNHDQLIAKKGRYYDLYMTQFAGNTI